MRKHSGNKAALRFSSSALALFLAGVAPAFAQNNSTVPATNAGAATPSDAVAAASTEASDIIVTAQRRAERLQDVPIAITAVTGESLKAANLTDSANIQLLAPSVIFNVFSQPGTSAFGVRGIATNVTGTAEQSVSVVIDGVVQAVAGQGLGELADVARIEVLRGPQGTLFGKNASAGVIQVITKRPVLDVFEADARLSYASYNEQRGQASLNIPLSETVAARVSGFVRHRDGYLNNPVRAQKQNDDNNVGVRGKLLWQPSDKFSALLIGDYSRQDNACCVPTVRSGNAVITAELARYNVVGGPGNETATTNDPTRNFSSNIGGSLELNYDFGPATLTSISAYREFKTNGTNDIDARPTPVFFTIANGVAKQKSQEVRLANSSPSRFEYTLGLFYLEKIQNFYGGQQITTLGLPACPAPSPMIPCRPNNGFINFGSNDSHFDNDSYAAFGQINYHLTPELNLIAGGRYTKDDYDQNSVTTPVPGYLGSPPTFVATIVRQAGTASTDNFSWRLGAQYTLSRSLMFYASATRGYKGPVTRNETPTSISLTLPEIPMSYEIGMKSSFWERRITLNVAAWTAKYKDYQATAFDYTLTPPASRTTNAGGLRTKGVEVELSARLLPGLNISGGATYNDVYFLSFPGDACFTGQTVAEGCRIVPGTVPPSSANDSTGNRPVNTPKFAWSERANYETEITDDLSLFVNANYYHKSSVFFSTNNSPFLRQGGYGVFGGSIGFGPRDHNWQVALFARNLFDKFYASRIIDIPTSGRGETMQYHDPEARRYIGASFDIRFGR